MNVMISLAVYHAVNNFVSSELSSFYLDIAKDVVYIEGTDHQDRRAMQTVMYDTLLALLKLMTPILPHTTDELWAYLEHVTEESIQLTDMPEAVEMPEYRSNCMPNGRKLWLFVMMC